MFNQEGESLSNIDSLWLISQNNRPRFYKRFNDMEELLQTERTET